MDDQRALLDQLMGKDRNRSLDSDPTEKLKWNDKQICSFFLLGFCPYQLLTNSKADIGYCEFIHDSTLMNDYQNLKKSNSNSNSEFSNSNLENIHLDYESKFLTLLNSIIVDLEKKIERHSERINLESKLFDSEIEKNPRIISARKEIEMLDSNLNLILNQIEEKALNDNVDSAIELFKNEFEINENKKKCLENYILTVTIHLNHSFNNNQNSRLEICQICGALLVQNDTELRILAHLEGKVHKGFTAIRNKRKELKQSVQQRLDNIHKNTSNGQQKLKLILDRNHNTNYYNNNHNNNNNRDRHHRNRITEQQYSKHSHSNSNSNNNNSNYRARNRSRSRSRSPKRNTSTSSTSNNKKRNRRRNKEEESRKNKRHTRDNDNNNDDNRDTGYYNHNKHNNNNHSSQNDNNYSSSKSKSKSKRKDSKRHKHKKKSRSDSKQKSKSKSKHSNNEHRSSNKYIHHHCEK